MRHDQIVVEIRPTPDSKPTIELDAEGQFFEGQPTSGTSSIETTPREDACFMRLLLILDEENAIDRWWFGNSFQGTAQRIKPVVSGQQGISRASLAALAERRLLKRLPGHRSEL